MVITEKLYNDLLLKSHRKLAIKCFETLFVTDKLLIFKQITNEIVVIKLDILKHSIN